MKKINKRIATGLAALAIATSAAAPIAATTAQPTQAAGIVLITKIRPSTIAGIAGFAAAAHAYHWATSVNNKGVAAYNRRVNKINRMHLVTTRLGYNYIYNKRGRVIRGSKRKPIWIPNGTILKPVRRRPYRIHGRMYYYLGKGVFFPKRGTYPYRMQKEQYAPTGADILGGLISGLAHGDFN